MPGSGRISSGFSSNGLVMQPPPSATKVAVHAVSKVRHIVPTLALWPRAATGAAPPGPREFSLNLDAEGAGLCQAPRLVSRRIEACDAELGQDERVGEGRFA